jgi:hypothetical protein
VADDPGRCFAGTSSRELPLSRGHGDSALHFFSVLGKITVLGEVMDGDVLLLHLTGNMKEELGGTPIFGEDVVLIIGK